MTRSEYFDKLLTQYRVVRRLSEKSEILLMRHTTLNKDIVFKSYDRPFVAYKELKDTVHDHLPEVYDVAELEDGQIVLEEYINGMTVADVLESGCYSYRGAKAVLMGVCSATMTLHSLGIIHRDIKPENVMITREGTVKLIDLDASRQTAPDKSRDTVMLGTIGYASPEQLGLSQSDERTDIYAIGVLLNVMLTGEHPSKKLARGKAGRIVLKCTQIDPKHRFESAEKLINKL